MSLQENYAGENALTLPKTGSSGFKSEEKGGMKDSLSSAFWNICETSSTWWMEHHATLQI